MATDKFRLRKHLQGRVEQWSKVLEISESRLLEDAITFYLRHLEGKANFQTLTPTPLVISPTVTTPITNTTEDDEEYEGDLEL